MSALTPTALAQFRDCLQARGSNMAKLAAEVGTSRAYLSRVIHNDVESHDTRLRLHAVTTAEEWALVCTLAHFATWNAAQAARPDFEHAWLMRSECMHCHGDRRFVPCCHEQAREITSGLCPSCLRLHYPEFAADIEAKLAASAPAAA